MKKTISKKFYDVITIGGGITGAGLLRDQAIQGLNCLLIDRGDFSGQTSQGSSKMLHGGIRYLENLDFQLVFEALKEKNIWLKLTPHLCYSSKFYLPAHKHTKYNLFSLLMGVKLYQALSLGRDKHAGIINKKVTQNFFPEIDIDQIQGCAYYQDAIVDDARLCVECILDALTYPNAEAQNYHELTKVEHKDDLYHLTINDLINAQTYQVSCQHLIFATGPFTDKLLPKLSIPWRPVMAPSKGSHLWLSPDALNIKHPVVLQTRDNRVIFIIPQKNAILTGTTEIKIEDASPDPTPDPSEVNYLIEQINSYFPKANILTSHIINSYAAIRPLVKSQSSSEVGKLSRHHQIFQPMKNLYVLVGGKYTTFRIMAQDLNRIIFTRLKRAYNPNASLNTFNYKSLVKPFELQNFNQYDLEMIKQKEMVKNIDDLNRRRLGKII